MADPFETLEANCTPDRLTVVGVDADDQPVLIFGIDTAWQYQSWGPSAAIWMLACEGIEQHARQVARESRTWTQALLSVHGPGVAGHNFVDARNTLHIRWLTWCGAQFTGVSFCPTDPSIPFLEFFIPQCANQSL